MENSGKKIRAAIIGGSGYGGSELIRILLFHPTIEIAFATANEQAGKPVAEVHRNLLGLTDLTFSDMPGPDAFENIDVAFFALPHGQAMNLVPRLPAGVKVIDVSGDFRINDPDVFKRYYKLEHESIELQKRFVYGLTEVNREHVAGSGYISNPGCFATATSLALAPMIRSGLVAGRVVVDAKTGSSGSGIKPAPNTHHPQRSNSFYAYKPFTHQHVPEVEQFLATIGDLPGDLIFMAHSLPVSRGIFVSCYTETKNAVSADELKGIFRRFYDGCFFVRLVDGSPDINWVKNTNFCDIAVHANGKQVIVLAAIDNLVKGAAGQAVQNMNVMFGLDEKTGLVFPGSNP